ncbi:MAG: hypothetical protein LBK26_03715 [Rickettsiales bacterium]|jgi:hypothetical protein|nr:hypothetical protein [Rickettsiales bacterium]
MRKTFILCSLLFALSACGWAPMHTDAAGGNAAHRDIFISPISGTNGIDLRNGLRAEFGVGDDAAAAKYALSVDLQKPETIYKALQITGDATWQEVRMTARYELKENATGRVIVTATDTASESYTFVRDLVAANASYNNAVQNTIRILSEKISTRIAANLAKESE